MKIEEELKTSFRNEYHKAFVNLHYTNAQLHGKLADLVSEYDLTGTQFNALRILRGQYPKAICLRVLKERMIEKNSDVSRIVDRLYHKQLIDRTESAADRRHKDVKINQKGLDLLGQMDHCIEQLDLLLSNLDESEILQFNHLLNKIRE
ncbi:MAG: MarR family transcriptional regulator [Saprospiraceae bacterium]|nr:MarR family transcriptional regulator [Saprospiraceae bacterium]MCB9325910.1 MarR family transcriptional regulator [Lewinellaceae bacterium]